MLPPAPTMSRGRFQSQSTRKWRRMGRSCQDSRPEPWPQPLRTGHESHVDGGWVGRGRRGRPGPGPVGTEGSARGRDPGASRSLLREGLDLTHRGPWAPVSSDSLGISPEFEPCRQRERRFWRQLLAFHPRASRSNPEGLSRVGNPSGHRWGSGSRGAAWGQEGCTPPAWPQVELSRVPSPVPPADGALGPGREEADGGAAGLLPAL